jgi:hypothetical protein
MCKNVFLPTAEMRKRSFFLKKIPLNRLISGFFEKKPIKLVAN